MGNKPMKANLRPVLALGVILLLAACKGDGGVAGGGLAGGGGGAGGGTGGGGLISAPVLFGAGVQQALAIPRTGVPLDTAAITRIINELGGKQRSLTTDPIDL